VEYMLNIEIVCRPPCLSGETSRYDQCAANLPRQEPVFGLYCNSTCVCDDQRQDGILYCGCNQQLKTNGRVILDLMLVQNLLCDKLIILALSSLVILYRILKRA
jgi:hypothetical protein